MPSTTSEDSSISQDATPRQNGDVEKCEQNRQQLPCEAEKVGIRERLRHFTWAWFTATMSTGGLAIVLAATPHRFRGLYTIGVIVFIFDLVLFATLTTLMALRAIIDPRRFFKSFTHPPEMFFFGSFLLSIAVILGGIQLYAIEGAHGTRGPAYSWLIDAIHVLYWIYASVTLCNVMFMFFAFMNRNSAQPIPVNASWFLCGYSAMLTGTVASLIAASQPSSRRMPIIVSGVAYQGFGFMWSFMLISFETFRLLQSGLPHPDVRPGMFITVGTPSYTVVALYGLAQAIPEDYGYFAAHPSAAETLRAVVLFFSIFLWLFAFWLFIVAFMSCVVSIGKMGFRLPWWAFIFPNVGFTIATIDIGTELGSEGILWVSSIMTILLVSIWLFTAGACIHGVWKKKIMWPGKDEDKDM